jgi:hypothetical protein
MFRQWANQAKVMYDAVGDFIDDYRQDKKAPEDFESLDHLRRYLGLRNACPEATKAAVRAWRRYHPEPADRLPPETRSDAMDDGYFREIRWLHGDDVEPPEGLAEGGIYQIRRDVDRRCWLVGWIPAEEVFSPPPVGTYVGEGATFAEVKAIAERDYEVRRARATPASV